MASRGTVLSTLAAGALVALAPTFVLPTSRGQMEQHPALRAQTAQQQQGTVKSSGAFVGVAAVAVAAAAMARGVTARRAARRELAVAYEESGIELLDNGKFAQGLVGSEAAWGRYEFDPVGFSKRYTELVPYFREAELKHGRVAMLAWLGLVVPDFVRVPGDRYSFEAVPQSIDAHDAFSSATGVDFQILFWMFFVELVCCKKVFEWNSLEVAGDYGLTAFFPSDEEGQKRMRIAELKNGRLAMIAFGGSITQAVLTHHSFPWLF